MTKMPFPKNIEALLEEAASNDDLPANDLQTLTEELTALRKANERPLNDLEMKALLGLISYTATEQKVEENIVCEVVMARFGLRALADLPSRFYQTAIEYLVDIKINTVIN